MHFWPPSTATNSIIKRKSAIAEHKLITSLDSICYTRDGGFTVTQLNVAPPSVARLNGCKESNKGKGKMKKRELGKKQQQKRKF